MSTLSPTSDFPAGVAEYLASVSRDIEFERALSPFTETLADNQQILSCPRQCFIQYNAPRVSRSPIGCWNTGKPEVSLEVQTPRGLEVDPQALTGARIETINDLCLAMVKSPRNDMDARYAFVQPDTAAVGGAGRLAETEQANYRGGKAQHGT